MKKLDLTDFAINLNRKRTFSEDLVGYLDNIKKAEGDDVRIKITEMSQYIKKHIDTGNTLELFQQNIDTINKEFFEKLTQLYPDLTQHEKELCGLIRLQLSNKEIARIKNISTQSARTGRYRLKKKLNLESEIVIADYLASL